MRRILALAAATVLLAGCADRIQPGAPESSSAPIPSATALGQTLDVSSGGMTFKPPSAADVASKTTFDVNALCVAGKTTCRPGAPSKVTLTRYSSAFGVATDGVLKDQLAYVLDWPVDCVSVAKPPANRTAPLEFGGPCTYHAVFNADTGVEEEAWTDN